MDAYAVGIIFHGRDECEEKSNTFFALKQDDQLREMERKAFRNTKYDDVIFGEDSFLEDTDHTESKSIHLFITTNSKEPSPGSDPQTCSEASLAKTDTETLEISPIIAETLSDNE